MAADIETQFGHQFHGKGIRRCARWYPETSRFDTDTQLLEPRPEQSLSHGTAADITSTENKKVQHILILGTRPVPEFL